MLLFPEKHKILFPYQFGFKKGYSIEQTILEITDSVKTATDQQRITCGVSIGRKTPNITFYKLDKYVRYIFTKLDIYLLHD